MNDKSDKLKEIADYILKSAVQNEKYAVVAEQIQRDLKCSDTDINRVKGKLGSFGTFTGTGFGNLNWKTFTLNTNGIEFTESRGFHLTDSEKRKDKENESNNTEDKRTNNNSLMLRIAIWTLFATAIGALATVLSYFGFRIF